MKKRKQLYPLMLFIGAILLIGSCSKEPTPVGIDRLLALPTLLPGNLKIVAKATFDITCTSDVSITHQ